MKYLLSLLSLLLCALLLAPATSLAQNVHACVVMPAAVDNAPGTFSNSSNLPGVVNRAVALGRPSTNNSSSSNFWTNGSTLRIKFIGGSNYVRQQVARYAQEWTRYANLNFSFVVSGPSDIRISFVNNGSSWSMLGSQARLAGENQATMNFGWFNDQTPDYEFRRTILHEFGHALGLLHEHQNPTGGIPWNEPVVYDFYRRTQGWDQQTTYRNVIARQHHDETQYSEYDPSSIMHYPVDPRLTRGNYEVGLNTALSATDASFIARMYPGRNAQPPAVSQPPSRPVVTENPSQPTETRPGNTAQVTISNTLGSGVRAETVELTIDNRKYVFRLSEGGSKSKSLQLQLRPGIYSYRVSSASIYSGLKRVWDGRRWVEKRNERTIYGSGSGTLKVKRDGALVFYGQYDENTDRMKVWLGEQRARR